MQIKFLFLLTLLMLFSLKADGRQYINLQRILVAISSCKIPVVNHDKILPVGISFNFKCAVLIDDMFARKDSCQQSFGWKKKLQMKDHRGYTTRLKVVAKQSLKNIQASTEPEPMTSGTPMKKSYECGVWIFFFCNYVTGIAHTTAIIFHFFTFLPQ